MAKDVKDSEGFPSGSELDAALTTLETVLTEASRAVAGIRSTLPQIAALAEVVDELETAMTRAREHLSMPFAAALQEKESSPLRSVAPPEAPSEPAAALADAEAEPGHPGSQYLQLNVRADSGSLDLKAVDRSVNENPAVVDVSLLDYDGRNATLKVWINESADPAGVREALLGSLRRYLVDGQDAEVQIDFEEKALP